MEIKYIHKDCVNQTWKDVEKFLFNALIHSSGEYDLNQLKVMLVCGTQHLLIAKEDGNIVGACTVAFENYPNDRIAVVTTFGGRGITKEEPWEHFENWCRENGCTKVRAFTFEEAERLFSMRLGFKKTYIVIEKKL